MKSILRISILWGNMWNFEVWEKKQGGGEVVCLRNLICRLLRRLRRQSCRLLGPPESLAVPWSPWQHPMSPCWQAGPTDSRWPPPDRQWREISYNWSHKKIIPKRIGDKRTRWAVSKMTVLNCQWTMMVDAPVCSVPRGTLPNPGGNHGY